MSVQIAVRLPEELVAFLDELVADGRSTSRAAAVTRALQRERRRERAARDAAILAADHIPDDLDDLAAYAGHQSLDGLD